MEQLGVHFVNIVTDVQGRWLQSITVAAKLSLHNRRHLNAPALRLHQARANDEEEQVHPMRH